MNPNRELPRVAGNGQQPNQQPGQPKQGDKGGQDAQAAADAIKQAAQAQAQAMMEAREAGLTPGQLPPPGAGDGTGGELPPPQLQALNLPNLAGVKVEDLMENWAKLKPKERQMVIDRMREKWPESYRRQIEAYLAVVGDKQSGRPVAPVPAPRK